MIHVRFRVEGRVQGVWFRDSTRQQARTLGLTGHAVNLEDGTVEVSVWGAEDDVEILERWLWHGPPRAEVVNVTELERAPSDAAREPPPDFNIG